MSQSSQNVSAVYYSIILTIAGAGSVLVWQVPKLPQVYYNLAFMIAYAVSLIFISTPLLISEIALGILSKKRLSKTFKYISNSAKFGFLALLILFGAALFLVILIGKLSTFCTTLVFGQHFILTQNLSHTLALINRPIVISLILSTFAITCLLYFMQRNRLVIRSASILTILSIAVFFILYFYNLYHDSVSYYTLLKSFFNPDFSLLTHFAIWQSAVTLALFSALIGLGVHLTLGQYLSVKASIRKTGLLCLLFNIIGCFLVISLCLTHNNSLAGRTVSHTTTMISVSYFASMITVCVKLFPALLTAALLCQVFKFKPDDIKHLPLPLKALPFIALFFAALLYQFELSKTTYRILSESFLTHLMLLIAYVETLLFGWIFDAQKLTYLLHKQTHIRLTVFFNISLRLIAPTMLLGTFIHEIGEFYFLSTFLSDVVIYLVALIVTVIIGVLLNRKFR